MTLRQFLKRLPGARSTVYFFLELGHMWASRPSRTRRELEELFATDPDPWGFDSSPEEQARFTRERNLLVLHHPKPFERALEIGCARGAFTRALAPLCQTLLAVDCCEQAWQTARNRQNWPGGVQFGRLDVAQDPLPYDRDLITVVCVLEYLHSPWTLKRVRHRIVEALAPDGLLLIGVSGWNDVTAQSIWGRLLLRGPHWITWYFGQHPDLERLAHEKKGLHLDCLFRKRVS
jgi:SAM-dependent methyltransferase